MKDKFQHKYRIPSARLKDFDYGSNGAYFITICTKNRECWFGNVSDGQMNLSVTGQLAHQFWHEIPTHFPFVILDEFVVMPNHIHGILIVNKLDDNGRDAIYRVSNDTTPTECKDAIYRVSNDTQPMECKDAIYRVSNDTTPTECKDAIYRVSNDTQPMELRDVINRVSTDEKTVGGITGNNNPMLHDNISRIVRWYKGRVSFECRNKCAGFSWQTRFYDHIIRDDASFYYITEYINNNPRNWHENDFHEETEMNEIKHKA